MKLHGWSVPMVWTLVLVCLSLAAGPTIVGGEPDRDRSRTVADQSDKSEAVQDSGQPTVEDEQYYQLLKLFADTLDQVDRNYVKDVSRRELMEAAIRGMMSKLDQHSSYIPPEELAEFRSGVESEFGGIGIQISIERGQLTIMSPLVGTPAHRAGLSAGDRIIRIDGQKTQGLALDEAVKRLKGAVGTDVSLTVLRHRDGSRENVSLKREIIRVQTVLGDRRNEDDTWNFMYDAQQQIAYLRITTFGRHTSDELRAAIEGLQQEGMQGLILDVRFNPGGLLSSAVQVCDMFVSDGLIVSTEGRNAQPHTWSAHAADTFGKDFPMVVLVNRYSASASEILAACLQDHGRAIVVGERTWGKGSVQNIIELEEGKSALKLTTAGYRRPNGKNIHRFPGATESDEWGVQPDKGFELKLSDDDLGQLIVSRRQRDILGADEGAEDSENGFEDPQLKVALEHVRKQLSGDAAEDAKQPAEPKEDAAPQTVEAG